MHYNQVLYTQTNIVRKKNFKLRSTDQNYMVLQTKKSDE